VFFSDKRNNDVNRFVIVVVVAVYVEKTGIGLKNKDSTCGNICGKWEQNPEHMLERTYPHGAEKMSTRNCG